MIKTLPAAVALALVLFSGLVHGLWSDRWKLSATPAAWAERLRQVPMTLGDWEGEGLEVDVRQQQIAEIDGYLLRRYINRVTRQEVTLVLLCGRPGPLSVHTPEVCFRGSGHELMGTPIPFHLPATAGGGELWTARFRKGENGLTSLMRVLWGWSADGNWEASPNPRFEFAQAPALYKLYVSRPLVTAEEPLDRDPAVEFLDRLLPVLRTTLFPGSPPEEKATPHPHRSGG